MKKLSSIIIAFLIGMSFSHAQLTVVTSNLNNPAGVIADDDGNAWVTETGSGANDGRVVIVKPNGDKLPVITGLPSHIDTSVGETTGAWRSMVLSNNRLAVVVGEGPTSLFGRIMIFNLEGFQAGVSAPKTIADTVSTIDISSFTVVQPGVTNSNPFSAALDKDNNWYVVDAGANMIVKITPQGQKTVFTSFSRIPNPLPFGPPVIDPVPTRIIANPQGGFYVSTLTGFPFIDGFATIYSVDKNGVATPYAKGSTLVTDLALDNRTGDLYALQFGKFGFSPSPGFVFGSGKVHRIKPGGTSSEVVAQNFGPGAGMTIDKKGNLYVTSLFTAQLLKMNNVLRCNNLDLELTADNNVLTLYNSIKYSLKVTNNGSSPATNVRVYWLPPYKRFEGDSKPFAYQAAYSSKGHYDSWNGYWTIDNLNPGESATAYFHLFVVDDKIDAHQTVQVAACNDSGSGFAPEQPNGDANAYQISIVTKAPLKIAQSLVISPNPADDNLNVSIKEQTDSPWRLSLRNTIGQTVFLQNGDSNGTVSIDSKKFNNGLYIIDFQSKGQRRTEKVLIRH